MNNLKFSVITPSFNQVEFIEQTILSVLDQNYPNFEHIIIDGESTDGTVEILKKYPHLKWVSEKDNGQTDALNKGFNLASGDVIAWINSDDWYFPDTFLTVAKYIKDFPIVYGDCYITDKKCNVTEKIINVEKSVFDILKYWVPYSIPTQPAIFFTKQVLLENVFKESLGKKSFLDDYLNYSMDFEWWLRIWNKYNKKKIDQVFAGYRMYDDNKTGQGMVPLEPEMSKVFRRFESRKINLEQTFSIVISLDKNTDFEKDLVPILQSIYNTNYRDVEIIINDTSFDKKFKKHFKFFMDISKTLLFPREFSKRIRYFSKGDNEVENINFYIEQIIYSRYILFLGEPTKIKSNFFERMLNEFLNDKKSLILFSDEDIQFNSNEQILSYNYENRNFILRKLSFIDVGRFNDFNNYGLSLKEYSLKNIKNNWEISLMEI